MKRGKKWGRKTEWERKREDRVRKYKKLMKPEETSDVDPDPVGSGFIWVRGSRGIKSLIK